MARIISVTPNPLLCFVGCANPEGGEAAYTQAFMVKAAGKGLCVARVLAKLGHDVTAVGFGGGIARVWLDDLIREDSVEPCLMLGTR